MTQVIPLVEYETCFLAPSDLREDDAWRINIQFGDKVTVEWPTPKTGNKWQLTSQGWVGYIPLGEDRGISLLPKVSLQNLFGMLEYAYDLGSFRFLEGLYNCESIHEFYERLAIILARRLLDRAREGLYKAYKEDHEELTYVRGCIDISALSRNPVRSKIPCSFEDHTIDVEDNQIIAWTLHTILRSGICTEWSIHILRKAERVMRNAVSLVPFCDYDCLGRVYNRLNADYDVLHKICRFFLENTGPSQNLGDRTMVPFLVDMARLFELFVARWMSQHLDPRYFLGVQESFTVGEKGKLKMLMDMVLYHRETKTPLCVLDTKYKAHSTVSNDDYYQVVAYADALNCENAVLIYPRQLEYPFDEKPGRIRVKTAVFDINDDLDHSGSSLLEDLLQAFQVQDGITLS